MTLPNSSPISPPKRLAFVITELEPGGAERCLVELVTRLIRSKYSPLVISLASEPTADKRVLVTRLKDAGISTIFLGFQRGWDYFAAVRRLTEILQTEQIELVQTFLFHANVVGAKAAAAAKVPHVFTGMRVADPRKWRLMIERWATSQAGRFVCVSQNVAEAYRWAGFDSEKLVVIPNGIELSRFESPPCNCRKSARPCCWPSRNLIRRTARQAKRTRSLFPRVAGDFSCAAEPRTCFGRHRTAPSISSASDHATPHRRSSAFFGLATRCQAPDFRRRHPRSPFTVGRHAERRARSDGGGKTRGGDAGGRHR